MMTQDPMQGQGQGPDLQLSPPPRTVTVTVSDGAMTQVDPDSVSVSNLNPFLLVNDHEDPTTTSQPAHNTGTGTGTGNSSNSTNSTNSTNPWPISSSQSHPQPQPSSNSPDHNSSFKSTASTIALYSSSPSASAVNVLDSVHIPPLPLPPSAQPLPPAQPPPPAQPLHQHLRDACIHGHLPAVRALLETAASSSSSSSPDQPPPLTATTPGDDGIPPLHWAAVNNHAAIARYLIDHHGAPVDTPAGTMRATPLSWAARKGHATMVHLLVTRGASPHAPDADGMHPVHLAAHHGWPYLVLLLVAGLGVPTNQPDASDQARPPLFFAVISNTRGGSYDAACVLLALGADPNARVGGFPLVHWALHRRALRLVELLITYGARPDATDPMGRNAAQVAREQVDVDAEWIYTWLGDTTTANPRRSRSRKWWVPPPVSDTTADLGLALLPGLQAVAFVATSSLPWYLNLLASLVTAVLLHVLFMKLLLRRGPAGSGGGDDPMEPPTLRHPRPFRQAPPGTVAGHRAVASSPYLASLIAWTLVVGGTHWAARVAPWVHQESTLGVFIAAWVATAACLYFAVLGDPGYLPQCGVRGVWPPPHRRLATGPAVQHDAEQARVAVNIDEAAQALVPGTPSPKDSPTVHSSSDSLFHATAQANAVDGRGIVHLADRDLLDDMHFCLSCMHRRPLRSKHCKQCGRCVVRFDHHCPWTWNCIGAKNHRVFVLLLLGIIYLALSFVSDWLLAGDIHLASLPAGDAAQLTHACLGFGPCMAFHLDPVGGWISTFGVIQVTWVTLLLCQQVYHAACNATTNEWINWFKYDHTSVAAAATRGGAAAEAPGEYRSARNREWHPVLDRGVARNCAEFWCAGPALYAEYFEVGSGHPSMSSEERVAARDTGVRRATAPGGPRAGWWSRLVGRGGASSPVRGAGGAAAGAEGEALMPMPVSVRG